VGVVQAFQGTYIVLGAALRGAGDTRCTMWLTGISSFAVRLPAVYVAGIVLSLGLTGVWIALSAEIVLRGMLFAGRFLGDKWQVAKV
jgi:Na+-driven multidrug efflux pump